MGRCHRSRIDQAVSADVKLSASQATTNDDARKANGTRIPAHFAMTRRVSVLVFDPNAGVAG
jgi:hypothetical protein